MNVEIAERLAARRKEAGLSQEALAEQLGVSRQAVSKWERSESSPDTDNLIALAKLYGVSLDDLLYVDHSFADDVEFEAADRAEARKAAETAAAVPAMGWQTKSNLKEENSADNDSSDAVDGDTGDAHDGSGTSKEDYAHVSPSGIHIEDGKDSVHISWREGIHVRSGKEGDEVHVGWDGVHVNEGPRHSNSRSWAADGADGEGNAFSWDKSGVTINGEHFDDWHEAHDKYGHSHWYSPCGYTVNGEHFDTIKEARERYGDEVGKGIPVSKHYIKSAWLKFPFPLVAIIAYLLIGFMADGWGIGLFVFFTIPLYYMLGRALSSKRIAPFIAGAYPIAVVAWFLYMAFVVWEPHPAWVIFLTIPLVEWAVHSVSSWWRRRKKAAAVIDVEAQ